MVRCELKTTKKREFLDITLKVAEAVKKSNVKNGIAVIFCPHTTAAITINENADPSVTRDMDYKTSTIFNEDDGAYRHSEGNSDAHIKSSLFGPSLTVIIENGSLVLGTWQGIYFCEFDGPRQRNFIVKVVEG